MQITIKSDKIKSARRDYEKIRRTRGGGRLKASQHKGFTLAEVLITLGIIGIVAAMTIPTLINNFQQKALDNQFKKAYATINQALRYAQGQYDYIPKCHYSGKNGVPDTNADCNNLNVDFISALKIIKTCENKAYDNGCIPEYEGVDTILKENHKDDPDYDEDYWQDYAVRNCGGFVKEHIKNNLQVHILADGTIIMPYWNNWPKLIAVDINGKNGPNKWGYDVFSFLIRSDGNYLRFEGGGCFQPEKGGITPNEMIRRLFR